MAVHADAVSEAVREVFEAGAVAGVDDDVARGGVDRFERRARLRGFERGALRALHDVEDLVHLVGRLAEDERARDVGLVAFDGAAVVDHDDRAFANDLRRDRAVRQRGPLAGLHARFAGKSDAVVRLRDQLGDIVLRHARLQRFVDGLVDLQRGGVGELHQRQLVRVLDHAAAGGDRRCRGRFSIAARRRRCLRSRPASSSLRCRSSPCRGRDLSGRARRARTDSRPPATCGRRRDRLRTGRRAICSRARSSSNAGQTKNGSPLTGMTHAKSRSPPPQRMPAK